MLEPPSIPYRPSLCGIAHSLRKYFARRCRQGARAICFHQYSPTRSWMWLHIGLSGRSATTQHILATNFHRPTSTLAFYSSSSLWSRPRAWIWLSTLKRSKFALKLCSLSVTRWRSGGTLIVCTFVCLFCLGSSLPLSIDNHRNDRRAMKRHLP